MTQPVQKIALIEKAAQKWYQENPKEKPIEYLGYGARSIKNYIFQWHGKEYVMNICGGFQNYCPCWHQYTTKSSAVVNAVFPNFALIHGLWKIW